jgi:hypothetical protein
MRVSNLIDSRSRSWKIDLLKDLVDSYSLAAILRINIPTDAPQDRLIWTFNPSDSFSVKSVISSSLDPGDTVTHLNSI